MFISHLLHRVLYCWPNTKSSRTLRTLSVFSFPCPIRHRHHCLTEAKYLGAPLGLVYQPSGSPFHSKRTLHDLRNERQRKTSTCKVVLLPSSILENELSSIAVRPHYFYSVSFTCHRRLPNNRQSVCVSNKFF
ncbi:hypothetical protein BDW22DRAFT_526644 [Trametopsis cervina]|nr:hypothetical protein BDW22DRAFT_526644 [Trametopsis cervina]